MNWRDLINKPKDLALRYFFQSYFKKYINRVIEFSMDAKNKSIHAVIELKGEDAPITFDVHYEITVSPQKDGVYLKANNAFISKEWLNLVAQEFIGKEFSIQGKDSAWLVQLLKNLGVV
jgi:hypothetical protein